MSLDSLRDRDSGRPRRTEEPKGRTSRRPNPSSRPPSGLLSQNPRSRSLRARSGGPAATLPVAIEEELWFGGHDPTVAEDTAARSMAALVGRIVGAKPFPESARRLAHLTRKDVVRIEPIVQVLERDPALSVRLLRLVNSAGYALRQSCTSVRHAATLVGTDRLHQIATTAAVLDLFDSRSAISARIIEHSTIVGAFCRYFGAHLALPVDDLFTAGFLHDIGKMMLLETEGDQYVSLLEKFADQPDAIHLAERSLYGFDHAVLAAHVLTEWNIPDPVPKIVAWHHDPTRAYRVSSMMAALVQTVRLADAAVCSMTRGVSQEEFSNLATAESASYLDISEPQLASMWDELQTLYRESIEQCRGENAPALDPRSMRPKQPISMAAAQDPSRSAELPLQFPCVVCGGPTFGNTCSACGGHMCPEHQTGREDWCTLCARDYHNDESEAPSALSPRLAVIIGLCTVLVSVAIGYENRGFSGAVRAGIGTCLLLLLAAVLSVVGHRWLLRFRFVRTRPNRNILEALENDGGVQSLVPPTMHHAMSQGDATRDSLSEHIRLSGAMVERVLIRDVPSIPEIIAPRPFANLEHSPRLSPTRKVDEASLDVPSAPDSRRHSFDAERLMMQSQSLVTLPAPANVHSDASHGQEAHYVDSPGGRGPISESGSTPPSSNLWESSMDSTSLVPIQPIIIEEPEPNTLALGGAPNESCPPSEGQIQQSLDPVPALNESQSSPEPVPMTPNVSTHPLAALGLNPEAAPAQSELSAPHADPEPEEEPAPISTPHRVERTTLLGMTADAALETIAAPPPVALEPEPALSPVVALEPEPALSPVVALEPEAALPLPVALEPEPVLPPSVALEPEPALPPVVEAKAPALPVDLMQSTPPVEGVVSLAPVPKSEPPAAPKATTAEDLAQPLTAALGPELLSHFGPDFQAKVMELVAERVAERVAQQMLQSLGQPGVPIVRAKPHRVPLPEITDSDMPAPVGSPIKRQRKRVAKH